MEVGSGNLGADNEFREKRRGRKKTWSLPLAAFLSFNDKDVHPHCPNASNPYHKCGRHCFNQIPSGKNFLNAVKSDGDREWEKKSDEEGINSKCLYASNPYHKCADYCLEKVQSEKGAKPVCKFASNPYHVCAEHCFQNVPTADQPMEEKPIGASSNANKSKVHLRRNATCPSSKVAEHCLEDAPIEQHLIGAMNRKDESELIVNEEEIVNLEGKNASNPSHLCAEHCSKFLSDRHEQVIRLKSMKGGDKLLENRGKAVFNSQCKYALNSYHECTEFCFRSVPDSRTEDMKTKVDSQVPKANIERQNASETQNICSGSVPERRKGHEKVKPNTKPFQIDKSSTFHVGKHTSNSYYEATVYSFDDNSEIVEQLNGAMKLREERIVVSAPKEVSLECKNASNHDHVCAENCFQNLPVNDRHGETMEKSKDEKKVLSSSHELHFDCKYASNPYHVCSEYCFENVLKRGPPSETMKKVKQEAAVVLPSERGVNAEYCFQNAVDIEWHGQVMKLKNPKELRNSVSEKKMVAWHSQCKFASNPYHVCAEYCVQNAPKIEKHGEVIKKLLSSKELKNSVSNKKITISGPPQCKFASNPYHECSEYCFSNGVVKTHGNKKENNFALRREDKPNCKLESKCSEGTSQRNEAPAKEITATVNEKKRISSKENKGNYRIVVEKINLNSEYIEASKPSIHKRSEYIEASKPSSHKGISLQDETKDLQSVGKPAETKNPTNLRPLQVESLDLYSEWIKYCSQTEFDEDEMMKQYKKEKNEGSQRLKKA